MDFQFMERSKIECGFSGTFFADKQDDFCVRLRELPAVDGIDLNDANVPAKRIGRGKESNHCCPRSRPGLLAVLLLGGYHLIQNRIETPSQAPAGVMALQLRQI
jgi:hypothetical protein